MLSQSGRIRGYLSSTPQLEVQAVQSQVHVLADLDYRRKFGGPDPTSRISAISNQYIYLDLSMAPKGFTQSVSFFATTFLKLLFVLWRVKASSS